LFLRKLEASIALQIIDQFNDPFWATLASSEVFHRRLADVSSALVCLKKHATNLLHDSWVCWLVRAGFREVHHDVKLVVHAVLI
jgi:hypothetical protein